MLVMIPNKNLRTEIRVLQGYIFIASLVTGLFFLSMSTRPRKKRFTEIDVERINVIEKDFYSYEMIGCWRPPGCFWEKPAMMRQCWNYSTRMATADW